MRRIRSGWLLMLGLVLPLTGCGYNKLRTLDEQVNSAASNIQVQLQRRADLIGNLVETVKGYAKQEQTVFGELAEARSKMGGAIQSGDMAQMSAANASLTAGLGRLMAVAEAYPELKSGENFKMLQDELAGTENRIAVARTDYNKAAQDFNTMVRKFPSNLTAKVFGPSKMRTYFEVTTPGAANAPVVKFNN